MEILGHRLSYKAGFAYQDILGLLRKPIQIEPSDLTRAESSSDGSVHILRIPARLEGNDFEIALVRELVHALQKEEDFGSVRRIAFPVPDGVRPYLYQLGEIALDLDADYRIRQYGFTIPNRSRKYKALIGTLQKANAVHLALKNELVTQLALQIPYVDFIDLHEHYLQMLIQVQYCKPLYDRSILIHDEYITISKGVTDLQIYEVYERIIRILSVRR